MTKSTWKNVFNVTGNSNSDSEFDVNDIVSSVSDTTRSENISRKNIDMLLNISGGGIKNNEEVPLVWELNEQSGGNIDADEFVSTEQLENKLRDIFTGLDENVAAPVTQQGGDFGNEIHKNSCDEKPMSGSGSCHEERQKKSMSGGNDETIPLMLSKLLEETGTNKISMPELRDSSDSPINVKEEAVTSDIDETLILTEANYYSDANTMSSFQN